MLLDFSQNNFYAIFEVTDDNIVVLKNFSKNKAWQGYQKGRECNIVEIQLCGENPDEHHAYKHTCSSRTKSLKYVSHDYYPNEFGNKLEFHLADDTLSVTVHYQFYTDIAGARCWTEVKNISDAPVGLEYVSSFSYIGIDDGVRPIGDKLSVYIPHNAWAREVVWKENTLTELGCEQFFGMSTKRVVLSNTGTWSSKEHLPMAAYRNNETNNTMMWQIESNGSWQWEISDSMGMMYLKLSGPNERETGWYKELVTGESFETVKVGISVGEDFNEALANMTAYRRKIIRNNAANAAIPAIFNDFMLCLNGNPTEENLPPLIDRVAQTGVEYFVIDCGWYGDGAWWDTVGEWLPSKKRFPNGINKLFDRVRSHGMIPGIWLEIEVMGIDCPLADKFEDECFFMRYGKRIIDHGRYHLDFRHEKVRAFATSVVDRVVNEYGVGYIKMDYNIDGGVGTEVDSDSYGDGLLECNRAFVSWMHEILDKYPNLIIENCSSGGLRMDYAMLSCRHLQSVTDNSNYRDISFIAANAPTAVLPEQAAIWSVPIEKDDGDAVAFNMVNSMLQRIHLSGELTKLSDENFGLVKEAIAVYKNIRGDIAASIPFYPLGVLQYSNPWRCVAFKCDDCTRLAVWRLDAEQDTLKIPLENCSDARILYPSNTKGTVTVEADGLLVKLPNINSAMIVEID